MIVEYIRYTIPNDRADEFAEAYTQAGKILDTDPHCFGYEMNHRPTALSRYVAMRHGRTPLVYDPTTREVDVSVQPLARVNSVPVFEGGLAH